MTSTAVYRSLKDRVVIITGSGQGLGRAYALHFAEQGSIVVLAEIAGDKALEVEREIVAAGGRALAITTDITDEHSVAAMVVRTMETYGRVDCLVNNASLLQQIKTAKFWDIPADVWRRVIDVNITGAFLCTKAAIPAMKAQKWGRIVNVSSPTVNVGRENYLHYVTSKSAMIGMTRAMARELGPWNITVNTFWPGVVMTELARESVSNDHFDQMVQAQCIKRPATMEDHARSVLFLCSEESAFITGQGLQSDGGRTFQ